MAPARVSQGPRPSSQFCREPSTWGSIPLPGHPLPAPPATGRTPSEERGHARLPQDPLDRLPGEVDTVMVGQQLGQVAVARVAMVPAPDQLHDHPPECVIDTACRRPVPGCRGRAWPGHPRDRAPGNTRPGARRRPAAGPPPR